MTILRWAGGKSQLLPSIKPYFERIEGRYYEPFIGGGAIMFALNHQSIMADYNAELIDFYRMVQLFPTRVVAAFNRQRAIASTREGYLALRNWDRQPKESQPDKVEMAARFLTLNTLCFNGLMRYNKQGHFNVPPDPKRLGKPYDTDRILALSDRLQSIKIREGDFEETIADARAGDAVYFDPPYDPLPGANSFTAYTGKGFDWSDQVRLHDRANQLAGKGVRVVASNAATDRILELWSDWRIEIVEARRNINSRGNGRGAISEMLACAPK
jgi:DNA adenine methylase